MHQYTLTLHTKSDINCYGKYVPYMLKQDNTFMNVYNVSYFKHYPNIFANIGVCVKSSFND